MFLEMKNQIWVERSGTAKPRVKRTRAQLNGNSWSEGKDLTQLVEIKSLSMTESDPLNIRFIVLIIYPKMAEK